MGRPKLIITRNRQLNIGLTDAEYETVLQRSGRAGMRPVDFARKMLLSKRTTSSSAAVAADTHLDPLLLNALTRIGSNINQIARQLNSLRMPTPPELSTVLRELREMLGNVRK